MGALDQVAAQQGASGPVSDLFAGAEDVGIGERRVGFEAIPSGEYLVRLTFGEGRQSSKNLTPSVVERFEIVEGLEGTVGRKTGNMDTLWLTCSRDKKDKQGQVIGTLDDKEYAKKRKAFLEAFNRFRHAHRILGAPSDENNTEIVTAWVAPAVEGAVEFLCELSVEIDNNGNERNKCYASSMCRPEDPVHDKNGKVVPGKTQVDLFREKIAKKAEAAKGRTAGARKGKGPF